MYKQYLLIVELYEKLLDFFHQKSTGKTVTSYEDYNIALADFKKLERLIRSFNSSKLELIPSAKEKVLRKIHEIHQDLSAINTDIHNYYYYDTYYEDLVSSIRGYINNMSTFGLGDISNKSRKMADYLIDRKNINLYLPDIKKIIKGTLSQKSFNMLYAKVLTIPTYKIKENETFINTLNIKDINEYIVEGFYNPFDVKEKKTQEITSLSDTGVELAKRKEIFNTSNIEYEKKCSVYGVYALKNFYKDDIIETAPIIFLDKSEIKNDKIKDIVFQITPNRYGLVLGYGSLYNDAKDGSANVNFALHKGNKQMYFIANKDIKKGDELLISYGIEQQEEENESFDFGSQPGDPTGTPTHKNPLSNPLNQNNPAYTGQSIQGAQY